MENKVVRSFGETRSAMRNVRDRDTCQLGVCFFLIRVFLRFNSNCIKFSLLKWTMTFTVFT